MELSMEWKRPNSSAFVDNYHYLSFVVEWKIPILIGEAQDGRDGKIIGGYFPMELFPNLDNILHKTRIFLEFFVYTERNEQLCYVWNEISDIYFVVQKGTF